MNREEAVKVLGEYWPRVSDVKTLPVSSALHGREVSAPAACFNDPAGRLAEPYLAGFTGLCSAERVIG